MGIRTESRKGKEGRVQNGDKWAQPFVPQSIVQSYDESDLVVVPRWNQRIYSESGFAANRLTQPPLSRDFLLASVTTLPGVGSATAEVWRDLASIA